MPNQHNAKNHSYHKLVIKSVSPETDMKLLIILDPARWKASQQIEVNWQKTNEGENHD